MSTGLFDIKNFLAHVPHSPGVYQMFSSGSTVIYVGKAKDLNKRLKSYFNTSKKTYRASKLISHIDSIKYTITNTETEALLLEHTYIRKYQPRYNVLLKDDKSYPFIKLSKDHHPRLSIHRGSINKKNDEFFGPYPSGAAVKNILLLLQKIFPIRQCKNAIYSNRTRPCLQYQIKRCLAPCVKGHVSDEAYNKQVNYVRLFLQGHGEKVLSQLTIDMQKSSDTLNFEKAAQLRDQLYAIKQISEKQVIYNNNEDSDVIGFYYEAGIACAYVFFVRNGITFGSRTYYPKIPSKVELNEVVETFLGQFYLQGHSQRHIPRKIFIDYKLKNKTIMEDSLSLVSGKKIKIVTDPKGNNTKLLSLSKVNARKEVSNKLLQNTTLEQRYHALKEFLHLSEIKRMECFDISHFMGRNTVASCVVFDEKGPIKEEYRRYNITGITPGDDYAAMEKVLLLRYNKRILPDNKIPDVIFIDGGKGQLEKALSVFAALNVSWDKSKPILIGVAKGADRIEGLETLFFEPRGKGVYLDMSSSALLLIQQIRNASHNHAIAGQRKKQLKVLQESSLEQIEGIGIKRRQALLKHFGGLQGLKNASIEQISKVHGISKKLAGEIYAILQA